jgi:chitinase
VDRHLKQIVTLVFMISTMTTAQKVVGYYPQWVVNNLQEEEIEFDVVTHVIHSFAWPDVDGSIFAYDGMFGSGMSNVVHENGAKFLLSLGGWGNHEGFEVVSADVDLREAFIYNLASILTINDYDGVDLDWEFPDSQEDKENLNHLVSEMDSIFHLLNSEWIITMAIPTSNYYGQWHDFEFLVEHVEFFNAMTYGTHGNWSSHAGHLSPLYPSPPGDLDGSCNDYMNYLANIRGIPKDKIIMGIPFWGIKWESEDVNESFTGSTVDVMYYDIPQLIGNGWTYHWDDNASCPYLIKDDNTRIITYENQESIGLKCQYVLEEELGGVMIWALSYDKTENGQELIQAIKETYLSNFSDHSHVIPSKISHSIYPNPFNPICNINVQLEKDSFVNIMVSDLNGSQVELLNNKILHKGSHQLSWKADDHASGIYFITIKQGGLIETKKITLLK